MVQVGALAVMLSTVAMLWNMVYNTVFDRLWPVGRVVRNLKVRALHAVGFEAGFILIGVPIAARMLSISGTGVYAGNRFLPVLPAVHHGL